MPATTKVRKPKSPYQRYQKTPYRYSAEHQSWRAAALRNDESAMRRTGRAHTAMIERRFGPLDFSHKAVA